MTLIAMSAAFFAVGLAAGGLGGLFVGIIAGMKLTFKALEQALNEDWKVEPKQ